jgi:lysozyme family protein
MPKINTTQPVICPTYIAPLQRYKIKPSSAKEIAEIVERINKNKGQYQRLEELTGVPWAFTAALHNLECDGRFDRHLANGDPVDRPTVNVPAGIAGGTWLNTAVSAYNIKNWVGRADLDWDNKLLWLWRAEIWWNGDGYRHKSLEHRSPYLWAGTTEEMQGKYVSDGVWDANAKSEQIGCVAIWDALGIKLIEGRNMEIKGNDLGLEKIVENEKPIGRLIATRNTWIKSQPIDSTVLGDTEKKRFIRDEVVVIYERLTDLAHHYQVVIKPDNQTKLAYVYQDHAGITIDGDDGDSRPTGLMVSDVSNLGKAGGSIAVGDKKAIQRELSRVGLLDGLCDGRFGPLSQSAWRAFTRLIGQESESITQPAVNLLSKFKSAKDLVFKPRKNDSEHAIAVKALNRMVELGHTINVSAGSDKPTFNIVYCSGIDPSGELNDNRIDSFNDLRFLIQVGQDGTVTVALCKLATVDAGQYWRDNPMNPAGCAQIDLDQQLTSCHTIGRHGARQYKALVQVGDIKITRDLNSTGLRDAADRHYEGNDYGINQHHSYNQSYVGIMSAGCLVGQSIAGHEQFMELLEEDRRYQCNNGYAWNTSILDGTKI